MSVRPWIAALLLINYLLVVGMDCVNRPEDQHELIRIQAGEEGLLYQQCRYLRMDGLELFLAESLASHYQSSSKATSHQWISVVSGVNTHCLSHISWHPLPLITWNVTPMFIFSFAVPDGIRSILNTPPWRA